MKPADTLKREDAPPESVWNPEAVYASWAAWEEEYEATLDQLPQLSAFQGKLGDGPETIAKWLSLYRKLWRRSMKLFSFANQANRVDTADVAGRSHFSQAMALRSRFNAAASFSEPELAALGDRLLTWAETDPDLAIYKHYFDNLLRLAPHRRSAEVEQMLRMLELPFMGPMRTANDLTNADMRFADAVDSQGQAHPVTQSTIPPSGIQSPDRERRRTAWEHFSDGYLALQNTLASNYITSVHQQVFLARSRGFSSVLEMRLAPNNVPVGVFENIISTFRDNLPVWHRYWDVKRRILGLDAIHPYDQWAPIVTEQPAVPYRQAVDWIAEAMGPLGSEYVNVMRGGCLEDRWVDYAPNAGKRQGAASSLRVDQPPYIFMSYDDSLMAMSVLAHELGHSMHSYFMDVHQPELYSGYEAISSSVAETASNFNQALLRAHLEEEKREDKVFQIALIDESIFNFHRYFFIMPTLARFEYEVFSRTERNQSLTAEDLNEIMADLFAEGYGPTMSDDPGRTAITWAQFGHLFMPFYTFQYAVGISASNALAAGVLAGQAGAADRFLDFLKAGGSRYSMDLFQLAGLDMSTPAPVEAAFKVLSQTIDRLETLAL